jgi:excisionase family DNA binding protein
MPTSQRKIMTRREAADELGVHEHTITRWMDNGELFYIYVGSTRKLTRELWEDFLTKRTTTGPLEDSD